jgi:hypothetical protein
MTAFLRGSLGPPFAAVSNKACFVECSIGGLPLPMNVLEVFTVVDQQRPESIENAFLLPAHESSMYGGVASELLRQLIPLASRSSTVDNPVEAFPWVRSWSSHLGSRVQVSDNRKKEMVPHGIGDFPDRSQCFAGRGGAKRFKAHAPNCRHNSTFGIDSKRSLFFYRSEPPAVPQVGELVHHRSGSPAPAVWIGCRRYPRRT